MKKNLIILCTLLMLTSVLLAQQANQQATNQPNVNAEGVFVDEDVIDIEVRSMAPVSGIYKSKADTFMASGKYRFMLDDKIIEDNSELLLNKWLKESK
ncbi:MAG: hypothetical protein RBR69_05040 [Candidatus Cloacimonadaceae bacterium]|jgi:hypothetical protein|nr:hypothetical protein [Candidatus Cloacimonadota bacterium]MDY0127475.1 hypothetical protein [Candidatus Cloacimonadaceae bacterium]MCB5254562.1 hypothetical protein [Candidatus Cloacimonadota bacterium]MCK9178521.1 hypothetical protein [Candidatus Cloacimonadota bacterium]MCK9241866.1 hypothetical protein [Candidatus Cloacimonadota bacterium]